MNFGWKLENRKMFFGMSGLKRKMCRTILLSNSFSSEREDRLFLSKKREIEREQNQNIESIVDVKNNYFLVK